MPALTPLPEAPSVLDPENFSEEADAFVAALGNLVTELNTIIGLTIPDGSAAANTLTGTTLAANVLVSSLTSLGILTPATMPATMSLALTKAIHGLTYDNGTDAVNDININIGGAMDATGVYWMSLATAKGKQSDVAWAVGGTTGAPVGMLDTGAAANADYYLWLIARSDTGVVDVLCSLSSTAPTMPGAGVYNRKRLIGWFKRVGGTIVAFKTYETEGGGIELSWNVPTLDVSVANTLTTARRTDALKVPLNFSTIARINVSIYDAAALFSVWLTCPDHTDAAPSTTVAPLSSAYHDNVAGVIISQRTIRTSATGTIAARASIATVDNYLVVTEGFTWARRN